MYNGVQVTNLNDVNGALAKFESLFLQIYNKHVPLRKKRVCKQTSPWLTTSIVKMTHERDYVKKKAISSGSKELWEKHKKLRNKVSSTIEVRRIILQKVFTIKRTLKKFGMR